MFLLFTCMNSGCVEFYEGGPRVRRQPMKCPAIADSLRNMELGYT
jgi:hypothetical protein